MKLGIGRWFSIGLMLAVVSACSPSSELNPSGVRQGEWALAEGEHAGKPLHFAFREDLKPELLKDKSLLVTVSWHYSDADPQGQPTPEQKKQLAAFERELAPALEKDHKAYLMAVVTIDKQHDWYFYANADTETEQRAREFAGRSENRETVVLSEADPEWKFYGALRSQTH